MKGIAGRMMRGLPTGARLNCIDNTLKPQGVAVVIEASHMCMMMRGVQKDKAKMITSTLLGSFKEDQKTRTEFLELIRSERSAL